MCQQTRAEGLYADVLGQSFADFFSLLHQQLVHSTDGRSYIIGSQVKGRRLLTRLFLQWTETSSGWIIWELHEKYCGHVRFSRACNSENLNSVVTDLRPVEHQIFVHQLCPLSTTATIITSGGQGGTKQINTLDNELSFNLSAKCLNNHQYWF